MPELPDVEVFRRRLSRGGLHREIRRVEVRDPSLLRGVHRDRLRRALRGHELTTTRRHGKHMFAKADGEWLVEHFGMTGYLRSMSEDDSAPEHTRFVLHVDGGRAMAYVDQRRLGSIGLAADPERLPKTWLLGNREDGARCPRGNGRVRRLRPTGRGAFYCPACQRT